MCQVLTHLGQVEPAHFIDRGDRTSLQAQRCWAAPPLQDVLVSGLVTALGQRSAPPCPGIQGRALLALRCFAPAAPSLGGVSEEPVVPRSL